MRPPPSRTIVAALACALLALTAATPLRAQSGDTTLIRVGAGPDDPSTPLIYADQTGMFKRAGLNVELEKLAGAAVVAAALAGGSLEIGKASTAAVVTAVSHGLPFSVIGSIADYNPQHQDVGLVVPTDSPIHSPRDLVGTTLAAVSLSDQGAIATYLWLAQNGVDPTSVKFVEIPASATMAAMEAGRVAGGSLYEPVLSANLATGKVRLIGHPFDGISRRFAEAVLFGNASWVNAHRDLVAQFLAVVQAASVYVAAHEDQVAPVVATWDGVDPATLLGKINHPGREVPIALDDIQPVIDAFAKYHVIPKEFSASEMICTCALRR